MPMSANPTTTHSPFGRILLTSLAVGLCVIAVTVMYCGDRNAVHEGSTDGKATGHQAVDQAGRPDDWTERVAKGLRNAPVKKVEEEEEPVEEECPDGNCASLPGETPKPICGNGYVEDGEEC